MKTDRRVFFLALVLLVMAVSACTVFGQKPRGPSVTIDYPPAGTTVQVAKEMVVQSTSTDSKGITKVELWVDSNLAHTDYSPVSTGQSPFSVLQPWTPPNVGSYTVIVKAYNASGLEGDSEALVLNVAEEVAGASPTATSGGASPTPSATLSPTATATQAPSTSPTATKTPAPTSTSTPLPGACPLRRLATIGVGVHPKGVAVDATQAYAGLHDSAEVAVVHRATNLFKAKWGTGVPGGQGRYANGLAIAKGRLYVANRNGNTVSAILISNPADVKVINVGSLPFGVAATSDYVFVANFGSSTVSIIDANTAALSGTTSVPGKPTMVAVLGGNAYVATWEGGVYKVGSSGSVAQVLPTRTGYFGVAANSSTNRVYIANQAGKDLTVLNAADNTVITTIPLGFMPHAMAANPQSNRIYVIAAGENKLYVIDGNTNKILGSVSINQAGDATEGGQGIAVYENRIYAGEWVGNLAVFEDYPCP
jgi:YVTN family beta-propeller protein